jgi:hypothetical protein
MLVLMVVEVIWVPAVVSGVKVYLRCRDTPAACWMNLWPTVTEAHE